MTYLTGDLHGYLADLRIDWFRENLTENDNLIILGDAGIFWNENIMQEWNNFQFPFKTIVVLGNHENYNLLKTFPEGTIYRAKCRIMKDNVYIINHGEILDIDNKKFFVFGGALSIDKHLRIPYVSWWSEEQANKSDYDNAINNLEKVNYNIDYFLAHDVQGDIALKMFKPFARVDSSTAKMLAQLEFEIKYHSNKPYEYYFGHWHSFAKFSYYTCLYDQILCLDTGELKTFPKDF